MKTGIYIRVSTEEQAEHGYSIRAQQEKLGSYAKIKDWNIYKFYIDEGKSGKSITGRSELINMLDDIKEGLVNNVLVFKIDRLTRSTRDLIDLVEFFNKYNCDFNSLTEAIDTTSATGRMFIKIIGLFAEFERENIIERIKLGIDRKAKEGHTICTSISSYGYDKQIHKNVLTINKKEAKIVKEIFNRFQKENIKTIRDDLNRRKIPTKKNKKWTNKTIKLILTNPTYIGKVRHGINTKDYMEIDGFHKPLISNELFMKTNEKLNREKPESYLKKYLICTCGEKMLVKRIYKRDKNDKTVCYINYICKNPNCSFKAISHKKVEKLIGNRLNIKGSIAEEMRDKVRNVKLDVKEKNIDVNIIKL